MISNYTTQLDDLNQANQVVDAENAFALPPRQVADALMNVYFTTVHQTFPILSQPAFTSQYNKYMLDLVLPENSKPWLAILNIIFAIGTVYSQLTQATWRGDVKDHLQYLRRAQALFLNSDILFSLPSTVNAQALAVTGIYFISTNQINR